jgi:hypothetical protein
MRIIQISDTNKMGLPSLAVTCQKYHYNDML